MTDYTYSHNNLLEKPNTYFYTEFKGIPFLNAWKQSRRNTLSVTGEEEEIPEVSDSKSMKNIMDSVAAGIPVKTHDLLDSLYAEICSGQNEISEPAKGIVYSMLRHFEYGKRIYESYVSFFKTADRSLCKNLSLYLKFGECAELMYTKTSELQWLNALLKCLDILCGYAAQTESRYQKRISRLIQCEARHISILAEKSGVCL